MANVMSKLLNIGMDLEEVIEASTWKPAQIIQRTELGNLDVGAVADVAILNVEEGKFGFVDVKGFKIEGDKRIVCELTLKDGNIMYDLNGISKPLWNANN